MQHDINTYYCMFQNINARIIANFQKTFEYLLQLSQKQNNFGIPDPGIRKNNF